jgi:hypothetical protein
MYWLRRLQEIQTATKIKSTAVPRLTAKVISTLELSGGWRRREQQSSATDPRQSA